MTRNSPTPQYPNENRKKTDQRNAAFTIGVVAAVAAITAAILITMSLAGRTPAQPAQALPADAAAPESAVSDTGAMALSSADAEGQPADTSSAIQLEGTQAGAITQADDRLLTIVNNATALPSSFQTDLTEAFDATIDKSMVEDFEALYSAGTEEDCYVWITYSYRSEDEQDEFYQEQVDALVESGETEEEAQAQADKTTQKGSASEYTTGLSIGLNTCSASFADTEEYDWLVENSYKYGFVLRYPADKEDITGVEYQPWRFRYVGRTHAKKMHELNLCLEEYVEYLNGQGDDASSDSGSDSDSDSSSAA